MLEASRPATESELKQLELLEKMVAVLEQQVKQKDKELDATKAREAERKAAEDEELKRRAIQQFKNTPLGF